MGYSLKNNNFVMGFGASNRKPATDDLTPAERKLLEQVADKIIEDYSETLKKLEDE